MVMIRSNTSTKIRIMIIYSSKLLSRWWMISRNTVRLSSIILRVYSISLNRNDLEALKLTTLDSAFFYNIITIPDDPTQMTANIKAPIIINQKQKVARQCVLQDNHLAIKEPIFTKLQSRVVQFPQTTIKSQGRQLELAVKLTHKGFVDHNT